MKSLLSITVPPPRSLADTMALLQKAAEAHSLELQIDYDRMLREFRCLWMIVRAKVHLDQLPTGEIRIETKLRKPSSVVSIRDYTIYEEDREIGYGIYAWTLVHADTRKLVSMKTVPPVLEAPAVSVDRTEVLKRISLPELMEEKGLWTVSPEEIDRNGHVNNVCYVRHGEALCPGCTDLEVIFDRECFPGEHIRLFQKEGFVRGLKEGGEECFRAKFAGNGFGRNE
ncbi:MAG: hypothetical protein IKM59_01705 [Oscillospiraceae bacterium]|nr:hypothetical protein [Oscillospiraceae bacterium]